MKYLVLADLHYDFWLDAKRNPFSGVEEEIADLDLLILAGDLSNKPQVRWKTVFAALARLLPLERVHVISGNHDYYNYRFDAEDRLEEFATAAGAHYTNCAEVLSGGMRFLCATLWTDYELEPGRAVNEHYIPRRLNDYRLIRVASDGYRALWPSDVVKRHVVHLRWLERTLSEPFEGPTFVVTHHAPHPDVLGWHSGDLGAAYASDLESLILKHQPTAWLYGHCHDGGDMTVGKTKISNVSLGYPHDVADPAARIRALIRSV